MQKIINFFHLIRAVLMFLLITFYPEIKPAVAYWSEGTDNTYGVMTYTTTTKLQANVIQKLKFLEEKSLKT